MCHRREGEKGGAVGCGVDAVEERKGEVKEVKRVSGGSERRGEEVE